MRYWSVLFFLMSALAAACFFYAPFDPDWWLAPNASANGPLAFGAKVDRLFFVILFITGGVFLITEAAMVFVLWKYPQSVRKTAHYTHGSKTLELVWTIIPLILLVYLTVDQMGTWAEIKFQSNRPEVRTHAEVSAMQFHWDVRYPGSDGKIGTEDDLHGVNDLHVVKDTRVLINLKTKDVLHSFFLPEMRIKQDAVPGLTIPVWFDADSAGTYDLVCAELCGWGHYKMRGVLTVHDSQADFDEWQTQALREQNRSQLSPETVAANEGE